MNTSEVKRNENSVAGMIGEILWFLRLHDKKKLGFLSPFTADLVLRILGWKYTEGQGGEFT